MFGKRLTNVTRSLKARDPDDALAACSANVADWSGGTSRPRYFQLRGIGDLEQYHWFVRAHLESDGGKLSTSGAHTETQAARSALKASAR